MDSFGELLGLWIKVLIISGILVGLLVGSIIGCVVSDYL